MLLLPLFCIGDAADTVIGDEDGARKDVEPCSSRLVWGGSSGRRGGLLDDGARIDLVLLWAAVAPRDSAGGLLRLPSLSPAAEEEEKSPAIMRSQSISMERGSMVCCWYFWGGAGERRRSQATWRRKRRDKKPGFPLVVGRTSESVRRVPQRVYALQEQHYARAEPSQAVDVSRLRPAGAKPRNKQVQ